MRGALNSVGKPGGLGEHIRCVVSVQMLTEGWDTRTVTHILGYRAFSTQLLCEQVTGRALRRSNYDNYDAEGRRHVAGRRVHRAATALHRDLPLLDAGRLSKWRTPRSTTLGKPEAPSPEGGWGNDPAQGFVYEHVPQVSASVLVYDLDSDPIMLVDQPRKKRAVTRVASPMTVESEQPWATVIPLEGSDDEMVVIRELSAETGHEAFVIIGEPDIHILDDYPDGQIAVEIRGYDTFDPATGNAAAGGPDDVACWMIDTDHDGESFYARRIHFPGAENDRQIKKLLRELGKNADDVEQEALTAMRSAPIRPARARPDSREDRHRHRHGNDRYERDIRGVDLRLAWPGRPRGPRPGP